MTAKEFGAALRKAREMTATEVAASRYADEIRCRMAGIPAAPPLPSGLYDEGFVRMHGTARAAGHNPHGLTVAQVGVGYRLLAREEIIDGVRSPGEKLAIEMWYTSCWSADWSGNSFSYTYRTKKPPGFFLPAESIAAEKVRKKLADPPPAGTKYVHTFVCHACVRTCTMETETAAPGPLVPGSFDMQCPFRRPEFVSLWKSGPVHTLTP